MPGFLRLCTNEYRRCLTKCVCHLEPMSVNEFQLAGMCVSMDQFSLSVCQSACVWSSMCERVISIGYLLTDDSTRNSLPLKHENRILMISLGACTCVYLLVCMCARVRAYVCLYAYVWERGSAVRLSMCVYMSVYKPVFRYACRLLLELSLKRSHSSDRTPSNRLSPNSWPLSLP